MSILRAVRTEMAGAWRSMRYDLGRRSTEAHPPAEDHPDVTSAGLSTFPGPTTTGLMDRAASYDRPPRRLLAASAFGLLALVGTAGSYVAVAGGLGGLTAERPVAQQPLPLVAEPDLEVPSVIGPARPAPGDRRRDRSARTAADRRASHRTGATVGPSSRDRDPRLADRPRPVAPAPTPCGCLTPPVPTPAPSPTGSGTPSPTPSPSTPSPDPSISPADPASGGPREPRPTYPRHRPGAA